MTAPEGAFAFVGAKAALFCGDALLAYLRDDRPGLPFAGMWDLPGGAREGDETPEACLLRELAEEFGLTLPPGRLAQRWIWPSLSGGPVPGVFFAGRLGRDEVARIRFGDEGQCWRMMPVAEFIAHPLAIPGMVDRVRLALAG